MDPPGSLESYAIGACQVEDIHNIKFPRVRLQELSAAHSMRAEDNFNHCRESQATPLGAGPLLLVYSPSIELEIAFTIRRKETNQDFPISDMILI